MAYTPPTIEELGGIEPYLDKTKGKHNSNGFAEFNTKVNMYKEGLMSKAALGRAMDVDPRTVDSWLELLDKRQEAKK